MNLLFDHFWWLFPLFFIAMWLFVCFIIAQVGWNRMLDFKTHSAPQGQIFSFQSATVGGAEYKGALNCIVTPSGLYMRPFAIFGVFHAPLFIPYSAFGAHKTQKVLWGEVTLFPIQTSRSQNVPITIQSPALRAAVAQAIANFQAAPPNP